MLQAVEKAPHLPASTRDGPGRQSTLVAHEGRKFIDQMREGLGLLMGTLQAIEKTQPGAGR